MTVYADTSFFVSIYVQDAHSALADQLLLSGVPVWLTALHLAEWAHAIGQHVFRRQMTPADAERLRRELEKDRAAGLWVEAAIPERAFDLCADLGRRYAPKLGLRTLDTLHVACALELGAQQFWTFDERQARLAKAEGLKIT